MGGWMGEWMDGWMDGWVGGRAGGRAGGREGGRTDGWIVYLKFTLQHTAELRDLQEYKIYNTLIRM